MKKNEHKMHSTDESMHSEMGLSVTKPNPKNCKTCSSKCVYDCVQLQYTTQHRTVLIISPLTFIAQIGRRWRANTGQSWMETSGLWPTLPWEWQSH